MSFKDFDGTTSTLDEESAEESAATHWCVITHHDDQTDVYGPFDSIDDAKLWVRDMEEDVPVRIRPLWTPGGIDG